MIKTQTNNKLERYSMEHSVTQKLRAQRFTDLDMYFSKILDTARNEITFTNAIKIFVSWHETKTVHVAEIFLGVLNRYSDAKL